MVLRCLSTSVLVTVGSTVDSQSVLAPAVGQADNAVSIPVAVVTTAFSPAQSTSEVTPPKRKNKPRATVTPPEDTAMARGEGTLNK